MKTSASFAIALCEKYVRSGYIRFAAEYGEPGYENPKSGILFADWNDCPKWLSAGLERRGFSITGKGQFDTAWTAWIRPQVVEV